MRPNQHNSTPQIGPVHRYAFIDALRGLAVLGVIFAHCSQQIAGLPQWVQALSIQGSRGVQLFFVASALTLFLSINYRKPNESAPTTNFFIRRFFRIAPLFYVAIIFYTILDGFAPRQWAPHGITWVHILATFTFMHAWHPTSITSVVPGGWTIAVEMTFYLFVPFLYSKIRRLYTALWATLLTLLASVAIRFVAIKLIASVCPSSYLYLVKPFTFFWFPTQAPVFLLGIILYFLLKAHLDEVNRGKTFSAEKLSSLFLIVSGYLFLAFAFGSFTFIPHHFLYGIAFVLFSYSLARYPYSLFVNKIICYIGKISFSGYVWHFVPIRIMNKKMPVMLDLLPHAGTRFLIFFFLTLIATIVIASLSYHYIEVPGMRLGRIIIKKLNEIRLRAYNNRLSQAV